MSGDNNYSCYDMVVITRIIGSCNNYNYVETIKSASPIMCVRDEWCECMSGVTVVNCK